MCQTLMPFAFLLDHQLKKITLLYRLQEKEVFKDLSDIRKQEDAGWDGGDCHMDVLS